MNKYLEKIAARVNAVSAARTGVDVYQLNSARKKNKKRRIQPSYKASRRLSTGPVRTN